MSDIGVVCRFISTQIMVGSCRGDIRANALIDRAVLDGFGEASQFEELRMPLAEYDQFIVDYHIAHPVPEDPRWALVRSFAVKMIGLGFTKAELKAVFIYLAKRIED